MSTLEYSSKELALAAAEKVRAAILSSYDGEWHCNTFMSGDAWQFTVDLQEEGRSTEFQVGPSEEHSYYALVVAAEYGDSVYAADPVVAVAETLSRLYRHVEKLRSDETQSPNYVQEVVHIQARFCKALGLSY